ncbi:MAG: glycoside hydrolase family 125 protein [Actinobacteria bacterium]|nr:glycoside hydrolase family 125 protein [Actinomycetota bacterium]
MGLLRTETFDQAADAVAPLGRRASSVFRRLFVDALGSAVELLDDGTAFVVTGDIPAMWLRDSTTQLTPYLHFLDHDRALADLAVAVSRRQQRYLVLDPYANAFNAADDRRGHQADRPGQSGWVWERKYEIDSLCYPVQLAYDIWMTTGRTDHLDQFGAAARAVVTVIETEQDHEARSGYSFERFDCPASDTLVRSGRGRLTSPVGLSWSGFRPSDDACEFGFNIPGNAFAVASLRQLATIASDVLEDEDLASRAEVLAARIDAAILAHGLIDSPRFGAHLAYEVDGFGGRLAMDDANVPSLLSLPMLGWCSPQDELYSRTRAFVLSDANPCFYEGSAGAGVGSPHTPSGGIWPIALAVQGLTATDPAEKHAMLDSLLRNDAGTGYMHESFQCDDPAQFTRPWFSWANAMFCELALDVVGRRSYRRPTLLREVLA